MAEVNVKVTATARDLLNELDKVDRSVDEVTRSADKMGRELDEGSRRNTSSLGGVKGAVIALGGAFAAAQVGQFVRSAISAASLQAEAEAKVTATVKSMNAETWTSVEALKAQATAFQDSTTFGDEAVLGMQDLLLTFGNVTNQVGEGNDIFTQATELGLDMSAALGQDLKSSAIQLGKALNDPIAGLTALSRVGIQFTDDQKTMIKEMVSAGDVLGAQKVILAELERQFGGTAEAMAETPAGQLEQQMNKLGDTMEILGTVALPVVVSAFSTFVGWIEKIPGITSDTSREIGLLQAGLEGVGRAAASSQLSEWLSEGDIREFSEAGITVGQLAEAMLVAQDDAAAGAVLFDGFAAAVENSNKMAWSGAGIIDQLNGKLDVMRKASGAAADAVTESHDALDRHRHSAERNRDAVSEGRDEMDEFAHVLNRDVTPAIDDVTTSTWNMIDAQRASVDPYFKARESAQRYQESLAEVNDAVTNYGEGSPEHLEAMEKAGKAYLENKADLQELKKGGFDENIEALEALYREMGFSDSEIAAFMASWQPWMNANLDKHINVTYTGPGGIDIITSGNAPPRAQHGGHVTRGGLVQVGEAGAELVDLPEGSTIYPHGTGPGGNGGVNITINGFVGNESALAREIDRVLTMRQRRSGLGFTT